VEGDGVRPKLCKNCKERFLPTRPLQVVCGPVCGLMRAKRKREAEEKKQDRVKRESLKTIPQLIAEAQKEFNAYIRERDKDRPCICCGKPLGADAVGGGYDCGHYRSTGSASHLRFDERNAHAQRKHCNRYGAGRAVDYRIGLVGRIGLDAVLALEADNEPVKWDRDTLRQIKVIYRAKTRALRKERG
jgi:hypothetical protein